MKPSVGRIVHYVSYGTPPRPDGSQSFTSQCRAAVVTEVYTAYEHSAVGLCVLNPTGQYFSQNVLYHDGSGVPGDPECPNPHEDGPHRYCACGWNESGFQEGTWHWPEQAQ